MSKFGSRPLVSALLYTSSNGDRWRLICDEAAQRVLVRHEANAPSGGYVTDTEVRQFLRTSAGSPERDAVMAMVEAAGIEVTDGDERHVKLRSAP